MTSGIQTSRKDVESVAQELGLRFEHFRVWDDDREWKRDVAYLFEIEGGFDPISKTSKDRSDAILFFNGKSLEISWKNCNRMTIRQVLESGNKYLKCAVCFETETATWTLKTACVRCNGIICLVCLMKMALTPEMEESLSDGEFMAKYQCVSCRCVLQFNLRDAYIGNMKRLKEFPQKQQDMLRCIYRTDPEAFSKQLQWNIMVHCKEQRLKKGDIVEVHGLENKQEWNGKHGEIFKEKQIKHNVIRWPVRLKGGLGQALLKDGNLLRKTPDPDRNECAGDILLPLFSKT